jgi:hypothetical protein
MTNNGVYSYSGRGGSLCTKYSEEALAITERALDSALGVWKENDLVGRVA